MVNVKLHDYFPFKYKVGESRENAMAFQSVPETAEIVIKYLGNTQNMVTVLQARLPGGYALVDLIALAAAVDAAVATSWLPIQTLDVTYIDTTVRGLEFINDQETANGSSSGPGASVNTGLPGNVTHSIKKSTGLTGRSARGRVFWIGMPRNVLQINENLLTIADSQAIEDAVDAMRVAIAATIWTPVVVSRFLDKLPRTTGATFTWIASQAVDINVDSQRRRLQA